MMTLSHKARELGMWDCFFFSNSDIFHSTKTHGCKVVSELLSSSLQFCKKYNTFARNPF